MEAVPIGTIKKLTVKGRQFVIAHSGKGLVVADALCPHMNEPLHKGKLNAFNQIICPLHEYRFDLETGAESDDRCNRLQIFQIEIESDGVYLII